MNIKHIVIFFGFFAFIAALLVAGAYFFLRKVDTPRFDAENIGGSIAPSDISKGEHSAEPIVRADRPPPTVIYENGAFRPSRVFLNGKEAAKCLVVLQNRSSLPLRIGMDPHNPSGKDSGLDFEDIAPDADLIFDPRFVGITELALHNHASPTEGFFVSFGTECQM